MMIFAVVRAVKFIQIIKKRTFQVTTFVKIIMNLKVYILGCTFTRLLAASTNEVAGGMGAQRAPPAAEGTSIRT